MLKFRRDEHRMALFFALICTIALLGSPALAQQKHPAPLKKPAARQAVEPAPTFDNLFAADSYRIYGEIRGVGGLIRSPAVKDLLDPVMKLTFGGPPKEFKAAFKWLNAHAEVLAGSRMLVAAWPARPKLPTVLIAIEFSSAEEAQKFEPELRGFMPTLLPTPSPSPTPAPAASPDQANPTTTASSAPPQKVEEPALPPYQMKQAGSLILLSDQPFAFRDLIPRGSKLLGEDQNFAMARNRFASEAIFLYVDVKSIEKQDREERQKNEEAERLRIESEAANPPKPEETPVEADAEAPPPPEIISAEAAPPPSAEMVPPSSPQLHGGTDAQTSSSATLSAQTQGPGSMDSAFMSLWGVLFGGEPKWPEAVGAAIAFEGDGYVVRTLIVNGDETKNNAIPFVPQFVTGPPLVPASPSILPADINLFVAVSLDFNQIYQGMVKAYADGEESSRKFREQHISNTPPTPDSASESPFAIYEKKLGLKIKDDVLPLLGNEIALAMPKKAPNASTPSVPSPAAQPTPAESNKQEKKVTPEPGPIIAISVRDKEGVKRLIPKVIESLGMKGANVFAQTEKRGETEITSYAGVFAYAFIGDFLVLSADAADTRHVVDFFLEHQTLSSDSHFRNSTRWQPRQVLGQLYVGPDLIERYYPSSENPAAPVNEKMREFLSQMNPVIEPVTYALSNDGMGPFHELHVPRSLLMLLTAGIVSGADSSTLATDEAIAMSLLRTVASAEATFQSTKGDGRYGTFEELVSEGLVSKDLLEKYGYKIDVAASGNSFEAVAIPLEYGKSGRLSYFVDESGVLRGGDHGGGAATLADKPVE